MAARVLVVEDNLANLELMVYLLHAFGHITVAVGDGEQALQMIDQVKPELIICDIQLPKLDGYEVVRRLKADPETRSIPIIAVTALAMVGDRDRIISAGFDGYLAKPIDPETFVQQVEGFLKLGHSEPPRSQISVEQRPLAVSPQSPATILVLDNVRANLDLACGVLEPVGYRVFTALTSSRALSIAIEHNPDLILSDICMPHGDGFEFIQTVKANPLLVRIPFVFLTSSMREEADRRRGLALGADKFLIRPIEPEVLLMEIRSCLSKERPQG